MISRLELKELASHNHDDTYFVSLFLNVDPKQVKKEEWQLHFKNLSKQALTTMPNGDLGKVLPDVERVERYISDHPTGMKRGLAVISSSMRNFWWVYHSALPFVPNLVIKRNPYLNPLVHQIDQYQRYLVAMVGSEDARLFIAGMGELIEVTDFYHPHSSSNALRDGSRGDMGEVRANHRREHTQHVHFKDIANTVEKLLAREEIKRVLLIGGDAARGHFKEALPEPLKARIVGESTVEHNARERDILERVLPLMKAAEYQFERKALAELFNRVGSSEGGSVLGMADVLTALQQGNVRKMYVMTHLTADGMRCKQCGALSKLHESDCSYCGGAMEKIPFIYDHAIQRAIDQGAHIDLLDDAPELAKWEGIGALHRY
jgi:peptide subunit release factor 1 (eRF1)